ncbi:MAG: methyl-accepting chemotaxis protein [Xanthobacteraceae bacterium]
MTNSNSQVKDGVDLVNKAGAALTEIVESIKKVAEVVSEIAAASAEQATGIEQVNKALTQMDEVTQQNSALVEENAATAKTLEQQAKTMDDEVSLFRVEQDEASETSAPAKHSLARPEAPAPKRAKVKAVTPKSVQTKAAPPKTAPVIAPAAAHRGNPVGRMQAALAAAVSDPQWQEF